VERPTNRKRTMKLVSTALLALLPWTAVSQNATNTKGNPVNILPDHVSYSDKGIDLTIYGASCDANSTAHGTGNNSGVITKYNCLYTGYDYGYDWAIACGTQKASKGNVACQAFRQGSSLRGKYQKLVSTVLNCDDIVTNECTKQPNVTVCPFNCSAPETLCSSFPYDIKWWLAYSYTYNDTFTQKTKGTVVIAPKRLTVKTKSKASKWRKLTMDDLCFEANAITTCYDLERITTYSGFNQCLNFRLDKHIKLGWLNKLDAEQILKAADGAKLYKKKKHKKKKHKKKKKKKKGGKTKKTVKSHK
jgi:hypothetical protein